MEKHSLESLLQGLPVVRASGEWSGIEITGLAIDSRKVKEGNLFFALSGALVDGLAFAADAVTRGAAAILTDLRPAGEPEVGVPVIAVEDARAALSVAAARFFQEPALPLLDIAVTGTNGKTSTAWIIANALRLLGRDTALVGTLGMSLLRAGAETGQAVKMKTMNTTPDALEVYSCLSQWPDASALVMEVTSQGIVQKRTLGFPWDAAVFTNLTRDHLDLHGSMENYEAAKTMLFTQELGASPKKKRLAVLNIDDPAGARMEQAARGISSPPVCVTYSPSGRPADVVVQRAECRLDGTALEAAYLGETMRTQLQLVGRYNVANAAAAFAVLAGAGISLQEIAAALPQVPAVPGRLERVGRGRTFVFVDYAHTPDALVNAQQSLRELGAGRLITVFGCGGDRDRGKRPIMGQVVAEMSDYAVVTSDNPRTENPETILDDIVPGVERAQARAGFSWTRIVKREQAIEHAISQAGEGDIVLVAGKGHEDYQEIGRERFPFLDRNVCLGVMEKLGIV